MSEKCNTLEDLVKAIKNGAGSIEIEGDLANKVIRIKAVGPVAWGVCAGALGIAIASYLATPALTAATAPAGGAAGIMSFTSGAVATTAVAGTLGSATVTAVTIGIVAGGTGVLHTLRDKYKIIKKGDAHIILHRR